MKELADHTSSQAGIWDQIIKSLDGFNTGAKTLESGIASSITEQVAALKRQQKSMTDILSRTETMAGDLTEHGNALGKRFEQLEDSLRTNIASFVSGAERLGSLGSNLAQVDTQSRYTRKPEETGAGSRLFPLKPGSDGGDGDGDGDRNQLPGGHELPSAVPVDETPPAPRDPGSPPPTQSSKPGSPKKPNFIARLLGKK